MLTVQEGHYGDLEGYLGGPSIGLISAKVQQPLPPILTHLQPWLKSEEKVVGEIANFVEQSLAHHVPWFLGGLVIGLFFQATAHHPRFRPIAHQEDQTGTSRYGTLEIDDAVAWIPIDGTNRANAFIQTLNRTTWPREQLAPQPIPVTFLPISDPELLYTLIIRMHKSARSVTRGETIRTAVEDRYSTYAKWLKGDDTPRHPGAIAERLVNWKSNTITNRLRQFTTLSTLYDSAKILDQAFASLPDPTPEGSDERYLQIHDTWKLLLEHFPPFLDALSGAAWRLPVLREQQLCMRPTGQLILINVLALAIREHISRETVIERLARVPWAIDDPVWQGVIIVEGRVNGRAAATLFTAKLVAYLIGIPLSKHERLRLQRDYKEGRESLPEPLFGPLNYSDDNHVR